MELVIFDMDGLLIDTEPCWQQTEREVFRKFGIEINLEMQKATFGLRTDEQIEHWLKIFPIPGMDVESLEKEYITTIHKYFLNEAELMPGAEYILEFFKRKEKTLALASSSPMFLIESFMKKFSLAKYFSYLHSAELEEFGKPHPAVYISVARKLQKKPSHCLAFEDSYYGLLAAKAARMMAVVVPDKRIHDHGKYDIADLVLNNLLEFGDKEYELFT